MEPETHARGTNAQQWSLSWDAEHSLGAPGVLHASGWARDDRFADGQVERCSFAGFKPLHIINDCHCYEGAGL